MKAEIPLISPEDWLRECIAAREETIARLKRELTEERFMNALMRSEIMRLSAVVGPVDFEPINRLLEAT